MAAEAAVVAKAKGTAAGKSTALADLASDAEGPKEDETGRCGGSDEDGEEGEEARSVEAGLESGKCMAYRALAFLTCFSFVFGSLVLHSVTAVVKSHLLPVVLVASC
jgi:hypothetical protein